MIVWLARPLERRAYLNDEYFSDHEKAIEYINKEFGPGLEWYRANDLAWVGYLPNVSVEEMDDNEYVVWGYEVR